MTRPCPCDRHLATRLLNQAPAWMPARTRAPGGGLDARYEQLRHAALHARGEAFPLGLGVLTRSGVTAWQRALASLAVPQPGPSGAPPGTAPARPASNAAGPGGRRAHQRPGRRRARRDRHRPGPVTAAYLKETPMLPETAASKVTAAHLSRTALLYVRQSSLKQVLHNTESAIRQYDLRGKAIAWAGRRTRSPSSTSTRATPAHRPRTGKGSSSWSPRCRWAGPGSCSAWNAPGWPATTPTGTSSSELCAMTGTLICDEDGLYDPRNFNDRLVLGMKGQLSEYELHFIQARLRGGQLSKARRGELIMPLPVGLVYDGAGHVILDPDAAIQGAVRHLFTTFEATGSATAVVKAFNAAGLTFPWRHLKGPRKGEVDWQPLGHHTVLRVLHNPRYAGCFTYGRHRYQTLPAQAGSRPAGCGCPARSGSRSSPAPTPDTSPWTSTRPTSPAWPPTPPRTAATAPPDRPAKAPPCCRASSSAANAAPG